MKPFAITLSPTVTDETIVNYIFCTSDYSGYKFLLNPSPYPTTQTIVNYILPQWLFWLHIFIKTLMKQL